MMSGGLAAEKNGQYPVSSAPTGEPDTQMRLVRTVAPTAKFSANLSDLVNRSHSAQRSGLRKPDECRRLLGLIAANARILLDLIDEIEASQATTT